MNLMTTVTQMIIINKIFLPGYYFSNVHMLYKDMIKKVSSTYNSDFSILVPFPQHHNNIIGPAVRADFQHLYPANAKTPTCCPSDDNRTEVTNSVTSALSLWWHVGPYFWPADLTRTANPIILPRSSPPVYFQFAVMCIVDPTCKSKFLAIEGEKFTYATPI